MQAPPTPRTPDTPRPGGLAAWALPVGLLVAGIVIGLSRWDPALAPLAYLGIALSAGLLASVERRVALGFAGLCLAALWVGQPWHIESIRLYVPGGPAATALAAVGFSVPWVFVKGLPLVLGAWLGRRWRWPVWAWLPVAWCLGEAAWETVSSLGHDGWLYAQWRSDPVLRVLGRLGWWPTAGLALMGAAALGEAIARRKLVPAGLAGAIALGFFAAPSLPTADRQAFEGVGIVHMSTPTRMPTEVPTGVRHLIWPEMASTQLPELLEGQTGSRLIPPIATQDTAHLIGLQTRTPQGSQNDIVAMTPDGRISAGRAKRSLFPLLERDWMGLHLPGVKPFVPGAASPVVTFGDRKVAALLCVEAMDRGLIAQARRDGAEMLVIAARDRVLAHSSLAWRQLTAVAVMLAVESGLPTVRASIEGPAAMIGPDGRVLASAEGTGILTLAQDWPARAQAPDTVVLYSKQTPWLRAALPESACAYVPIEGFKNPGWRPHTVVVAGHSDPPSYLGHSSQEVARAVASLNPQLVVLDTCFGASTSLLDALAASGVQGHVVGPPIRIPDTGLVYEPGFSTAQNPAERARRVRTEPRSPLYSERLDRAALVAATARVAGLNREKLRASLVSLSPPLACVTLPHSGAPVVVPVGKERF